MMTGCIIHLPELSIIKLKADKVEEHNYYLLQPNFERLPAEMISKTLLNYFGRYSKLHFLPDKVFGLSGAVANDYIEVATPAIEDGIFETQLSIRRVCSHLLKSTESNLMMNL